MLRRFSLVVSDRIAAQIAAPSLAILQSAGFGQRSGFSRAGTGFRPFARSFKRAGVDARDLAQVEMMGGLWPHKRWLAFKILD